MKKIAAVVEYIRAFTPEIQQKLQALREVISTEVPADTVEKISYQIPTYHFHENLVHFAAFRDHISLFPTGSGIAQFKDKLSAYKISKGTVQFPVDNPLPLSLIRDIVRFRVREVMNKR